MGWSLGRIAGAVATGGLSEAARAVGSDNATRAASAWSTGGLSEFARSSTDDAQSGFDASRGGQIYDDAFNTQEMSDARSAYQEAIKKTTPTADMINQESSQTVANLKYSGGGKLNPLQQAELVNKLNVTRGQQVGSEESSRMAEYYNSVANLAKTKAAIKLQAEGLAASTQPDEPSLLDKMGLGNIF